MQAILRRVKKLKFASEYNRDVETRKWVRYLGALAFVPPAMVGEIFNFITAELGQSGLLEQVSQLRNLYIYFKDNYVGSTDPFCTQSAPRFPPAEWNQFGRVRNKLPRSDASLEGHHFGMQATLGVHPQFYAFAAKLKASFSYIFLIFDSYWLHLG